MRQYSFWLIFINKNAIFKMHWRWIDIVSSSSEYIIKNSINRSDEEYMLKEKVLEMLKLQEKLDENFMKYTGNKQLNVENVRKALFDECGETNHEMKATWCYWKKSQNPVDRDKLKEELSDVYHFALSLHRLKRGFKFNKALYSWYNILFYKKSWFDLLAKVASGRKSTLYYTIVLTEKLGFTFDEMYDAYIEKNNINYKRMEEGY